MLAADAVGVGLRFPHFPQLLKNPKSSPFYEVCPDNFLQEGPHHHKLEKIRREVPIVFHCVGMNLGSVDNLDFAYLKKIKELAERYQPLWISDHMSWSGQGGSFHHDLLPLPYTAQALNHFAQKTLQAQNFLGDSLLIENVSDYIQYNCNEMSEWEFISALQAKTDCRLLLDLNNIIVNGKNHHFDPITYLQNINPHAITQLHLAGHEDGQDIAIDTHGGPVPEEVRVLYYYFCNNFGPRPALIEWDKNLPSFEDLLSDRQLIFDGQPGEKLEHVI